MTEFPGKLVIISGPSGAGKSTVVERLLECCDLPLQSSVSATTRQPRPGEKHGVNYWFVSPEEFRRRLAAGEFLECCEVFGQGDWYGTLREPVATGLREGKWVILEIDVQGAHQAVEKMPEAITIFVHPGSIEELEKRLRGRKSETEQAIQRRLEVAREELRHLSWYKHEVVNRVIDASAQEICRLLHTHISEPKTCTTS